MKRVILGILLCQSVAAEPVERFRAKFEHLPLQHTRTWRATIWGEEALVNDAITGQSWLKHARLKNFPWSETTWVDPRECREIDEAGLATEAQGSDAKQLRTRHRIESGQWMLDTQSLAPLPPDSGGNERVRYTAPGGLEATLTFDSRGDLSSARYSSSTLRFSRYAKMAGAWLPREETLTQEGLATPESYFLESARVGAEPQSPVVARLPALGETELPLSLVGNRWTQVQVKMGTRSLIFLLDSGASHSTLDTALAQELRLLRAGSQKFTAGLFSDVCWVRALPTQLGDIKLPERTVLGLNMHEGAFARVFPRVSGILGRDLFARFVVVIDYAQARLRFVPREKFRRQPDDQPISCRREGAGLAVQVKVNGMESYFALDTGNGAGIVVQHLPGQKDLVSANGLKFRDPEGVTFGSGVAAAWPGSGDFTIGPFLWKQAPLMVVDESSARGVSLQAPGNLGVSFLRHFRVSIDLTGGRLWLAQTRVFRHQVPATLGLRLRLTPPGGTVVEWLSEDGPAARAGIQLGDSLIQVNDALIDSNTVEDVLQECQLGETFDLELRRGTQIKRFRVAAVPL